MSDSELSDAPSNEVPPDSQIETTLREEVKKAAKGPLEDYTVSKIRKAAENSLGLSEGFFKGDEDWKARSKAIIEEQVNQEDESAKPEVKPATKAKQQPKSQVAKKPVKRSSPVEKQPPRKKRKVDTDEDTSALSSPPSGSDDDFEEQSKPTKTSKKEKKPAPPKSRSKPAPKAKSKADVVESDDEADGKEASDDNEDKDGGSESEMSVVLDEAPPTKGRRKSKNTDATEKKSKPANPRSKASAEVDPDQEEVKKLQGWLVKCGIRKVWGKELKPYGTPKAKVKHLKEMLAGAGMTGRYSNEKAAQIKEARELAADMEAVQEGNERWGKDEDEAEDAENDLKTRGGRRLVRGAKNYDFLSSDGEETD